MAITTVDALIAGMNPPLEFQKLTPTLVVGRPHSLFYVAGTPGAAVANSSGAGGAALTTYAGQMPFTNPVSGNTHLARLVMQSSSSGQFVLVDRLWHNSGLSPTVITAQTVNSVAWPARSADGTANGASVLIGVEVMTATGAGAPTFSMSYTNQAGTLGQTGTGQLAGVGTSAIGAFYPMGLAAGDTGVRSIQTFTLSATWTSGTFALVAYRVLARLPQILSTTPSPAIDAITGGMPRMFDNSVPFCLFIPRSTAATDIVGDMVYTQG